VVRKAKGTGIAERFLRKLLNQPAGIGFRPTGGVMKKLTAYPLVLLAVVAMTWVVGCNTAVEAPDTGGIDLNEIANRDENPDLNDSFGGYNMKDETPAFGDATLLAEFAEDEAYDDPIARITDVAELDRPERAQLYLMVTWGNLHRDSTIAGTTDWSGGLQVDPGVIVLKRTIRFERNDHIVPRTQRDLLEWQSQTTLGFDGVLVKIHPLRANTDAALSAAVNDSSIDSSQVEILFKTEPLSVAFTLDQLPNLNRVITLDDGNAVAFTAVYVTPNHCPHGPMRGVWRNDPERQGGVFYGRWATANGKVMGFLKGIYGKNDAGEKVFYGKMIDENGRFEGIMKGRYDNHPSTDVVGANSGGWFAGRWVDRNLNVRGHLKGEWMRSNRCHGGFFRGHWAMACPAIM
jgi:hypothetical protein